MRCVELIDDRLSSDQLAVRDLARVEGVHVVVAHLHEAAGTPFPDALLPVLLPGGDVSDEVLDRPRIREPLLHAGAPDPTNPLTHRSPRLLDARGELGRGTRS